jgi:hypothetical protein
VRIGDKVWYATRKVIPNATTPEFEAPVEVTTRTNYLTIMPASSRGGLEVLKFGEAIFYTWTGVANARAFANKFKAGDKFWIDGHAPVAEIEEKYGFGASANAVVKLALPINHSISLVLVTNQEQVK